MILLELLLLNNWKYGVIRVKSDIIKHQEGADPAAVVFDAIQAAKARKADVLYAILQADFIIRKT